jgi:hypothetical protein
MLVIVPHPPDTITRSGDERDFAGEINGEGH